MAELAGHGAPWLAFLVLLIVTVLLAMGSGLREPPLDTEGTLPRDSAVAKAMAEINELFGNSGEVRVTTLLFRGDALTPAGLSQMDALIADLAGDPDVVEVLAPADPLLAPASLVKAALQVGGFDGVTQEQIDSARNVPGIGEALAAMTGTDADGTPIAVASIRLRNTGDERVVDAKRRISGLAARGRGAAERKQHLVRGDRG